MHYEVKRFLKQVKKTYPYKFRLRNILEVGSLNINGSPRKNFTFCKYTGVDLAYGKGVDIVGDFNELKFDKRYGVVISTEMLEHDKYWDKSIIKMYQLLNNNGLMIITCAAPERPEHGTSEHYAFTSPMTNDYYHNISIEEFKKVLPKYLFKEYVLQYARGGNDLQFYGIKLDYDYPNSRDIYSELISRHKQKTQPISQSDMLSFN